MNAKDAAVNKASSDNVNEGSKDFRTGIVLLLLTGQKPELMGA